VRRDLLGGAARAWLALGVGRPPASLRLVLADVDGVITRGEGQPAELDVLARVAASNTAARRDPAIPAITLCTGRQAPYVELMAQLTDVFLPCSFEHGAGLFFPTAFHYEFDARLGPDYSARLAQLRAALDEPLLKPGRAFVQPGKEATMTLYPLGDTPLDELFDLAAAAVARVAPEFDVARNVRGVELRPRGIDKGSGAHRIAELLDIPLAAMAGVGDSDPDLSFLDGIGIGFSAAPANATPNVRRAVEYVAQAPFGAGLLEIVALVEAHNRKQTLTET
jgi:3-deoxy-D-manno-octulosonate 8-phosphate phosphatase KdsC-like HAD superfamily phosphatase